MRSLVPVSGKRLRANPVEHWQYLERPVRAWFARRVVLIGAESTGKSTLAADLTRSLRARGGAFVDTQCVAEFGRDYAIDKWCIARAEAAIQGRSAPSLEDIRWESPDFVAIARVQNEREERAAGDGGPVLVCDTDALATSVWHERYLRHVSSDVDRIAAARSVSLYLLTHCDDVPFVQDGTRDGESIRSWMTHRIEARLFEAGLPFVWLRGDRPAREAQALLAIDTLLSRGWELAAPLG